MKARDNPYRVERLHRVAYRFDDGDRASLLRRFKHWGYRGALVGPHGSGKTTLLAELTAALRDAGHHLVELRLTEENRSRSGELLATCCRTAGPRTIFVLDGAEQLGFLRWRWLLRRSREYRGLLITTHSTGRLQPLLRTIPFCNRDRCRTENANGPPSVTRLKRTASESLSTEAARRNISGPLTHGDLAILHVCRTSVELLDHIVTDLDPDGHPGMEELSRLYQRHRGNLRDCLRELYDRAK